MPVFTVYKSKLFADNTVNTFDTVSLSRESTVVVTCQNSRSHRCGFCILMIVEFLPVITNIQFMQLELTGCAKDTQLAVVVAFLMPFAGVHCSMVLKVLFQSYDLLHH